MNITVANDVHVVQYTDLLPIPFWRMIPVGGLQCKKTLWSGQLPGRNAAVCARIAKEKGIQSPTVARRSRKTSELYFGCGGFLRGCRFKGCRSH
jgi:hypothetical protein